MEMPAFVTDFLGSVEKVADSFTSLRVGNALVPLCHPFWTADQIAQGLTIKRDWDLPENLIPFLRRLA